MRLLFFAITILLASSAWAANDDDVFSMSIEQMMEMKVETASRQLQDLGDAPANMLVISQQEIRARHYHNLLDVLEDLPGLHIQHHTSSTHYHRIAWRGNYGSNKFLLLLNGIRIGDPAGDPITIAGNFSLRAVERIEVLYGPASALYGADAVAGVINLMTRHVKAKKESHLEVGQGSNHFKQAGFRLDVPLEASASLMLAGHVLRDDTADLSRYYPQDFAAVDARTFGRVVVVPANQREPYRSPISSHSGFASLQLSDGFDIGVYHNRVRHLTSIGEKPSGVIYDPKNYWQQDISTVYARYRRILSNDLESLTTLNISRLGISPTSSFKNRYTDFVTGYQYMRNDRIEIDQQLSWSFNNNANIVIGFNAGNYHSIPKTPDTPWPVNPDVAVSSQAMFYPNTNNSVAMQLYDIRYRQFGVYLQHHWHISDHWSSVAGLRYDYDSRYRGSLNPRLGLIYRIASNWTWKLMYGEAFRAPSTVETHEVYGSFSGAQNAAGQYTSGFFHLANPNLKPEKSRTLELTFQGSPWSSLYGSVSTYYSRIRNVIFAQATNNPPLALNNAAIATIEINKNIGNERFYGGEFYLRHEQRWNDHIHSKLWGSYSYLDGRLDQGAGSVSSEIPYVAKQHLRLGLNIDWQQYYWGSSIHFVGKSNSNVADALNPSKKRKIAGYSLYDMHIGSRKLWPSAELDFAVYNLFDRRYYNSNSGGIKFTATQQQPRTLAVSLKVAL